LLSGSVDIGFFGPEAAVYVYQQGADDPVVGFAQLTARDGSFLMARHPGDIFDWSELRGKTVVGARRGGVPQMVLEYVLRKHGIEPFKDVEIITHLAFEAAPGAFASGLGDYIAQFDPTLTSLERQGVGKVVASLGREAGEIAYTVYHARRSFLDARPETVLAFTRAIYKGQKWVDLHTAAEIAEVVKGFFPEMDDETLVTALERYKSQDSWRHTPIISRSAFQRLLDVMIQAGELAEPVPFDAIMTNRFALAVAEE
ncbi:MAG: ABC transporter substrate-binding protein, partial [Clostridia bacterium]